MCGQLHAADDRIIARILVADAVRHKRGNDSLVVEDLRHAAAEADDPAGCLQQLLRRIAEDTQRKIGLRKQEQRLRPQKQVAQLVRRVAAVVLLAANGNVEADREAGKIARAAGVAQINDLVELKPQALCDLQRVTVRHAAGAAEPVVRIQILIHPSGRKRGGVALHLQDHVQEPHGLHGLLICFGRSGSKLAADARDLAEVLHVSPGGHLLRQLGIAAHERTRAVHHEDDALIKIAVRRVCRFQMRSRLCAQTGRAETEPFFCIRADMAL